MTAPGTATMFRFAGTESELDTAMRRELFDRSSAADPDVAAATRDIIERVRAEGDDALRDFAGTFDKVELRELEVPQTEMSAALAATGIDLRSALLRSARNIRVVHEAQRPREIVVEVEQGVTVSRRPDPLDRVGVYAPGGTAAYASSVLMAAIPARVAGVREIILCSPPSPSGIPSREVLAAAQIAGVDRVFAVGGAGAIAAMALGTRSIPSVDRIVGPGNAYVAEAKIQLASQVGIDCPAGPSELLVIADASASPDIIAREVMAQAEHDVRAVVVVVTIGSTAADAIEFAIASGIDAQPRREIIRESLRQRGFLLSVTSATEAIDAATRFAPEHLLIAARDADEIAARVRSAGAVFIGEPSSVAFGDYMTGANHVLPTGGLGRAYSGLSTLDFIRWTSVQRVTREGAGNLAAPTAAFARAEKLPGHAAAAEYWGTL